MGAWAWVFWVGGCALGVLGLWLLYWAVLADRARGRRRCPRCWYDMAGVPGLRCPECGREAKGERGLRRTRRSWRAAVLALVVFGLAGLTAYMPTAVRLGWPDGVPTWMVVVAARCHDTKDEKLWGEIQRRMPTWATERPSWPSRVAIGWHGRHLVEHPPRTMTAGPTSGWFTNYMPSMADTIGYELILQAGPQARQSFDFVRARWKTERTRISDLGFASWRRDWAGHCTITIAIADQNAHGLLERLMFQDADSTVRQHATSALSDKAIDAKVATPLISRALFGSDESIRRTALNALMTRGELGVIRDRMPELVKMCDAPTLDDLLRRVSPAEVVPFVCECAIDPDVRKRRVVMARIAAWGKSAAGCRDRVVAVVQNDSDADCRAYAVLALGWICDGREETATIIARCVRSDPSELVRSSALEPYIACQGLLLDDELLTSALGDRAWEVRAAAVRCLARLTDDPATARSRIAALRDDPEAHVRVAVDEALRRLGQR